MHAIRSIDDFYAAATPYVSQANEFARKHSLAGAAVADHICYKCRSHASFDRMRAMFEGSGRGFILDSSTIPEKNGRTILYILLADPLETMLGSINYLELCDQKPDGSQKEGFDHVEAYPAPGTDYHAMVEQIRSFGGHARKVERPHHTTHEADMGGGFSFVCSKLPLIKKIREEKKKK